MAKSKKQQAAIAMSMKAKGVKPKKMAKGGSSSFGMLSVKKGIDNNPSPTYADKIAGATKGKAKMGGSYMKGGTAKKYQIGGEKHPLAKEGEKPKAPSKRTMRMIKRAVKKQNKSNPGRIKLGV